MDGEKNPNDLSNPLVSDETIQNFSTSTLFSSDSEEFLGFSGDSIDTLAETHDFNEFPEIEDNCESSVLIMAPKLDKAFTLKFIPEFDGNRGDLHKFITCCDIINEDEFDEADTAMFLNIVRSKMTGSAYNITKYKNFSKWSDLKEILLKQFLEQRTLTQIQTELVNCKQGYRESVRVFANRVEKLLSDLNDACIASEGSGSSEVIVSLNSKTALKAFVEGLQNPLKLIIKASRFSELAEAVEAAVEEEKTTSFSQRSVNEKKAQKCSYCHKLGHSVANCYLRAGTTLPKFPPSSNPPIKKELTSSAYIRAVTCTYCKNKGHHIRDCRKRAYNESRRSSLNQGQNSNEVPNCNRGNERDSGANGGATRAANLR